MNSRWINATTHSQNLRFPQGLPQSHEKFRRHDMFRWISRTHEWIDPRLLLEKSLNLKLENVLDVFDVAADIWVAFHLGSDHLNAMQDGGVIFST